MKARVSPAAGPAAGVRDALIEFALGLPGAHEDHPWGETVAKVRGKVFVFFGVSETFGFSAKLPHTGAVVLGLPFAEPTGYGLGKSGWVSINWSPDQPFEMLANWIEESYRAVAPKRLVAELDRRGA